VHDYQPRLKVSLSSFKHTFALRNMARDDEDEGLYFPPSSGGDFERMIHAALNSSSDVSSLEQATLEAAVAGFSSRGECFNASLLEKVRTSHLIEH